MTLKFQHKQQLLATMQIQFLAQQLVFQKEIFLTFQCLYMNNTLNNDLRPHHDQHDPFLDNNFLMTLEYHGELQNAHRVYQFPYRKQ